MKEDLQDIGDFYKNKFEEAPFDFDKTNWMAIQPQLDKIQFLRFAFFRFNVYYLSVIVLSFLFSAYLLVHIISTDRNRNRSNTQNNAVNKSDSVVHDNEEVILSRTNNESMSGGNVAKRKPSSYINIMKPDHYSEEAQEEEVDSSYMSNLNLIQPKAKENQIAADKEKKITEEKVDILYITKQDTIVVVDTVSSATAKRRMKKNKMYGK